MIKKLAVSYLILFNINTLLYAQDVLRLTKIAVLPADVRLIGNTQKLPTEKIYQAELITGFKMQTEMYAWFINNAKKFNKSLEIQDIQKTNQILFSGGMSLNQYRNLSADSIARLLNVDAVLFCKSTVERSVKDFDPLPILTFMLSPSLLTGVDVATTSKSEVHRLFINLNINNKISQIPIWSQKYGHYNNGIYKLNDIFKRLLREASHQFPTTK